MEENAALLPKTTTQGRLRHSLYFGLQARIAKELGVSRSNVCEVMGGKKTSKRITAAIEKEIARIERRVERQMERAA